jgi:hypothetical protein
MFKTYQIEAALKFASAYNSGYKFTVCAKTKSDAIKTARKEVRYMGHTRQDGPLSFSAYEVEA